MTAKLAGVLLALGLVGPVHAAPPCQPAVILTGDPTMIAQIATTLESKGLAAPIAGCPAERVHVERHDDSIVLSITDPQGRDTSRTVGDASTATALIETFATFSIVEDRPITVAAVEPVAIDREQPPVLATPAPSVRGNFAIALETSVATDGSLWAGARGAGCVRIGRACVGGVVRFARDAEITGDAEQGEASRLGADLLFTGEYAVAIGAATLTTGAGLGVGWLRVRRTYLDVMDGVEVDTGGLRGEVHVGATLPFGTHFDLKLGASFDFAPFAHTAPFHAEGLEAPGEPRAFGRLDIGLELHTQ